MCASVFEVVSVAELAIESLAEYVRRGASVFERPMRGSLSICGRVFGRRTDLITALSTHRHCKGASQKKNAD